MLLDPFSHDPAVSAEQIDWCIVINSMLGIGQSGFLTCPRRTVEVLSGSLTIRVQFQGVQSGSTLTQAPQCLLRYSPFSLCSSCKALLLGDHFELFSGRDSMLKCLTSQYKQVSRSINVFLRIAKCACSGICMQT